MVQTRAESIIYGSIVYEAEHNFRIIEDHPSNFSGHGGGIVKVYPLCLQLQETLHNHNNELYENKKHF